MKDLFKLLGIEQNLSTAYHPQTDGQTERGNQEIEQYLRTFINYKQNDWSEWLSLAEFSINDKVSSTTSYSPFYLDSGCHPWKGIEPRTHNTKTPVANSFAQAMQQVRTEANAALKATADTMKHFYDQKRNVSVGYKSGDKVLLNSSHIPLSHPSKKFSDKHLRPFKVVKPVGASSYEIALAKTWKIHPVFNKALLSPHPPSSSIQPSNTRPPPTLDDHEHGSHYVSASVLLTKINQQGVQSTVSIDSS